MNPKEKALLVAIEKVRLSGVLYVGIALNPKDWANVGEYNEATATRTLNGMNISSNNVIPEGEFFIATTRN